MPTILSALQKEMNGRCVPHSLWFLQIARHAIWVNQPPCHFPKVHEQYIQWHAGCPCYHLLRRHTSLLRLPHRTQETCPWGAPSSSSEWTLLQTREMSLRQRHHQLPWLRLVPRQFENGPVKSADYTELTWTTEGERHSIFPRFCKLLPSFHLKLLRHRCPAHPAHS